MRDWRPGASLATQKARAALYRALREFFFERGVLEVDTPLASWSASHEPHLASCRLELQGRAAYLATSPEYPMKRLLAAGSGPIYQIAHAFRDEPAGRLHNPEFTLLEWYRPAWRYHDLIDEVHHLIEHLWQPQPLVRLSYAEAFETVLGLDPHRARSERLAELAAARGLCRAGSPGCSRALWLDFLLGVCVLPELAPSGLVVIYDFPVEQASLASIRLGEPPVAERFEFICNGVELANGYQELTDAEVLCERRALDLQARRAAGQDLPPVDEALVAALSAGLDPCAGVALGLDRLLLLKLGLTNLDEVLAFSSERV